MLDDLGVIDGAIWLYPAVRLLPFYHAPDLGLHSTVDGQHLCQPFAIAAKHSQWTDVTANMVGMAVVQIWSRKTALTLSCMQVYMKLPPNSFQVASGVLVKRLLRKSPMAARHSPSSEPNAKKNSQGKRSDPLPPSKPLGCC